MLYQRRMKLHSNHERRGAAVVEFALILPVLFLLLFGSVIVGLGVFRYQRVAAMARDAARYALVHSGQWAQEQNKGTLLGPNDIYQTVIQPRASGFDLSDVGTGSDMSNIPTNKFVVVVQYDNAGQQPVYQSVDKNNNITNTFNRVKVLVKYQWQPELYWGVIPLQSTSEMRVSY